MFRTERQPTWQRDITWASGVLLALTVMVGTLLLTQSQLASETRGTAMIRGILQLTLLPAGEAVADVGVRTGSTYQAGQPLTLLPGVEVFADATEIPVFTPQAAIGRVAGVLTGRLIDSGGAAMLGAVTDPVLGAQLSAALSGPIATILRAELESELLPSGLDDGTRLADWRAQAAANPGSVVQPIVGIFVYESPTRLSQMSNRDIGRYVVAQLSEIVRAEGLPSALVLVTNPNLRARLEAGAGTRGRAQVHGLIETLLLSRGPELEARLAEARAVLAGEQPSDSGLSGLLPAAQVAALTPEQANAAVLDALAQRAYAGGGSLAAAQLTRQEQAQRVQRVAPLIDAFSAAAHGRYRAWTYLAGAVALLLLVLMVGFSRGLTKLVNAGLAIGLGAVLGAALFPQLGRSLPEAAALPVGAQVQGVFGALSGLLAYAVSALPDELLALAKRNHLVVLLVAGGLIALALLLWVIRGVRPRRRSYL